MTNENRQPDELDIDGLLKTIREPEAVPPPAPEPSPVQEAPDPDDGVDSNVAAMREQIRSLMGSWGEETEPEAEAIPPAPEETAPPAPEPDRPRQRFQRAEQPEPAQVVPAEPEPEPEPEPEEEPEPTAPLEELPEEVSALVEEPSAPPEPTVAEAPAKKRRRSLWELPLFRLFRRETPKPQEEPPRSEPPVSAYIPDDPVDEGEPAPADEGPELLTDILPPSHMRQEEPIPARSAAQPPEEPEPTELPEQPEPPETPEQPEPVETPELPELRETAEEPTLEEPPETEIPEEPEDAPPPEDIPDDVPLSDSEWEKLAQTPEYREPPKKPSVQEERRVQVLTLHVRKREDAAQDESADRRAFDQDETEIEPRRPVPEETPADDGWEQMVIPGLAPDEPTEPPSQEDATPPESREISPSDAVAWEPSRSEPVDEEDEEDEASESPEDWDEDVPDESLLERPERGSGLLRRAAAGAAVIGANLQREWAKRRAAAEERRRTEEKDRRTAQEEERRIREQERASRRKARTDETPEEESVSPPVRRKTPKDNVVEMPPPEQPGLLQRKLEEMEERANQFADSMFQSESEEGQEEEAMQRMAEQHIPGTDEERPPRKPKKQKKPERDKHSARRIPDTSPRELARIYNGSWRSVRGRLPFQLAIAVVLLGITAVADDALPFLTGTLLSEDLRITGLLLAVGLLAACVVGLDTLLEGILQLFRGRPGLNTLSSIGVVFTLIDALWYAALSREGPLPFCGFAALSLWTVAWGNSRKKEGQKRSSEDVAARSSFERLTMDEDKWEDRGTFMKEPGSARGFGRQMQDLDGAEQVYRYAAPVMMIACLAFGVMSAVGQGAPQRLIWSWSVIFILATPLSATLAYGLPYARLVKRLHSAGAVIAGWDGAASMQGEAGIVFTDRDLFPEGSVERKDIRSFGYVSLEKLIGCTASIIREADVGLAGVFDDLVRIHGGFYRRVDDLSYSNAGGFSGMIRGDQVLVGTADFMQVMKIEISPGYQVRNAVFCAINGQLQGVFPLIYSLPPQVRPAVNYLVAAGIHPILATRDFNITPAVLRQRFRLPVDRMQYPSVEHRFALSAKGQPHNETLGALIFREGVEAYTAAILGGRRLVTVVRLNTVLTVAASVIGALLGFYLTLMSAYASLSPLNILVFLLAWLVPTLLISNGADKF
ncbi:MAG: hypothetical protein LUC39_09390 [Clostridiales bacterium]|nr:hypothetical protein [Clostridiales bacterium]